MSAHAIIAVVNDLGQCHRVCRGHQADATDRADRFPLPPLIPFRKSAADKLDPPSPAPEPLPRRSCRVNRAWRCGERVGDERRRRDPRRCRRRPTGAEVGVCARRDMARPRSPGSQGAACGRLLPPCRHLYLRTMRGGVPAAAPVRQQVFRSALGTCRDTVAVRLIAPPAPAPEGLLCRASWPCERAPQFQSLDDQY